MNKTLPLVGAALVGMSIVGPARAFKITWTGVADGSDAYNEGNWVLPGQSPPAPGTVDPGNPINLLIEIGDTPFTVDASTGPFTVGQSSSIVQVSGGVFTSTDVIRRDTTPDVNDLANVSLVISDSTQDIGRVTARGVIEMDVALVNRMTLTDGGDPLRFSTVGFSSSASSGSMLTLTNETVSDVVAQHLAKFRVGGEAAQIGTDPSVPEPGDNLRIISDGLFGSIITPVTTPIMPGDTDGDGDIDDIDLGTMIASYTGPVGNAGGKTPLDGDTDNDGDVDDIDLGTMIAGYTGPLAPASVPEPASMCVFVLGLATLGIRRRRVRVQD